MCSSDLCTFFESVGHPECVEAFGVRDPVSRAANIDKIYDKMREIAITRTPRVIT